MTRKSGRDAETNRGGDVDWQDLPVDPDVDTGADERPRPDAAEPAVSAQRGRWPHLDRATVVAVAVGGFAGGLARYAVGQAWPTPAGTFPWATWTVNTAGAFVLGLLVVLVVEVLPPTRHLRALLGTGFCGALTTFSAVATDVVQLVADGYAYLAAAYLAAGVTAGLAAASFGVVLARSIGGLVGRPPAQGRT